MTRRRWFEAPVDQPWIARVVCAFPTRDEVRGWWHHLIYRFTHAGQWATPEWNLDPEPNMGPPWPETDTEKEKTP